MIIHLPSFGDDVDPAVLIPDTVPVIVTSSGAQTSPADYCASTYAGDPGKKAACLALPSWVKPWTIIGKAMTNLQSVGSSSGVATGSSSGSGSGPVAAGSIFGIPDTIFYVGAGVLALGGALYVMRRRNPKLNGYRRKRRSR
jgi:hypothetical protein